MSIFQPFRDSAPGFRRACAAVGPFAPAPHFNFVSPSRENSYSFRRRGTIFSLVPFSLSLRTYIHLSLSFSRSPSFPLSVSHVEKIRRARFSMMISTHSSKHSKNDASIADASHDHRGEGEGNLPNCFGMAGPILGRRTYPPLGILCISPWQNKRANNARDVLISTVEISVYISIRRWRRWRFASEESSRRNEMCFLRQ